MLRAVAVRQAPQKAAGAGAPFGTAVLQHDERHLRRRAITLTNGGKILVDLPQPVVLVAGDELVLEDGAAVAIAAAEEPLYAITARDAVHLAELAWHIGNRHLPAAITADRILILRDHVIKAMLEGLGATICEIVAPFDPVRGAYGGHGDSHDHVHGHDHSHHHHHHDDRQHHHHD